MRDKGIGIGNQAFSALRNNARQSIQNIARANQLPDTEIIPLGLMNKNSFSTLSENFKYTITFEGIDTITGETRFINRSIASNDPLTKERVLFLAEQALNPKLYEDAQNFFMTDSNLTEGKINKNLDLSTL